eukprot:1137411-Pelagomonas_calceolata.AAC.1
MDGNGKKKEEEPVYINMIAGGISGAASKTATAPLARLTILYQVCPFVPNLWLTHGTYTLHMPRRSIKLGPGPSIVAT